MFYPLYLFFSSIKATKKVFLKKLLPLFRDVLFVVNFLYAFLNTPRIPNSGVNPTTVTTTDGSEAVVIAGAPAATNLNGTYNEFKGTSVVFD